jgi:hypothetical protein
MNNSIFFFQGKRYNKYEDCYHQELLYSKQKKIRVQYFTGESKPFLTKKDIL